VRNILANHFRLMLVTGKLLSFGEVAIHLFKIWRKLTVFKPELMTLELNL
jgi:hypothetical protein